MTAHICTTGHVYLALVTIYSSIATEARAMRFWLHAVWCIVAETARECECNDMHES